MRFRKVLWLAPLVIIAVTSCTSSGSGPAAWLDRPLDDSVLALAPTTIMAHASDGDGVSQFLFEVDGASIATVDVDGSRLGDASIEWSPPRAGTYLVSVRAVDSSGNLGSIATSRVTVGGPTPTPDALILVEPGKTSAEPAETTFAEISFIECGPGQTVFVDISLGNPEGVSGYSVYSTWADVSVAETFSEPLPQLIQKRIELSEPIDTVDRQHQFILAAEIPGQSSLISADGFESGGRCPGHYQEEVEMAASDPTAPLANATQNANCRSGPSLEYDIITILLAGQTAEITGRSADSNWWVLDPGLGDKTCWISSSVVEISGDVSGLAVIAAPPMPVQIITPTPTPTVAAPVDDTPPSFYSTGVSPDSILTDGTGCPGYDRTTTVAASVADEGGLTSVYALWSIGSETGTTALSLGGLGYWATIGPVNTAGTMAITLYAEDTSGNTSQYGPLYVTVQNCIG